VDHS
jgi:hypothetical protein